MRLAARALLAAIVLAASLPVAAAQGNEVSLRLDPASATIVEAGSALTELLVRNEGLRAVTVTLSASAPSATVTLNRTALTIEPGMTERATAVVAPRASPNGTSTPRNETVLFRARENVTLAPADAQATFTYSVVPPPAPTPIPTPEPTPPPPPEPTSEPTDEPTRDPTPETTPEPTPEPTADAQAPTPEPMPTAATPPTTTPSSSPSPTTLPPPWPTPSAAPERATPTPRETPANLSAAALAPSGPSGATSGTVALAVAAASIGGASIGGALAIRRWPWLLAPLYARLSPQRALQHPARQRLVDLVRAEPGVTYSEAQRRLGLANGEMAHHVYILERQRTITSARAGQARRLYLPEHGRVESVPHLGERALRVLGDRGAMNATDLAAALGCSRQALAYHLKKLSDEGRVTMRREGGGIVVERV